MWLQPDPGAQRHGCGTPAGTTSTASPTNSGSRRAQSSAFIGISAVEGVEAGEPLLHLDEGSIGTGTPFGRPSPARGDARQQHLHPPSNDAGPRQVMRAMRPKQPSVEGSSG